MPDQNVCLVTQLPSDSWFEGLCLRPNGKILATRLDKPEIYTFVPEDTETAPTLIATLSECVSVFNICPVPNHHEEYFVLTGDMDLEKVTCDSYCVWYMTLSPDDSTAPVFKKLHPITNFGFLTTIEAATDRILLIADAQDSCIITMDTHTGKTSKFMEHDSMKVVPEEGHFGLNRIAIADRYLWYTNTSAGTLCRIPITKDGVEADVGIRATGPVEVLTDSIPHCDGLAVTKDESTVYTASYIEGLLNRITIDDKERAGYTEVVTANLDCPTGVAVRENGGEPKIYVTCCGKIEMAWFVQDSENPWSCIADINSAVTVTVTETVVEST
ncbi:hypothetical protein F4809DRAFT_266289 [Biscogniauxia mediterranea]|nr:hypothetical protein F4809DRAFT_266289 [Biscogniauxia mediterranea]